MKYECMLKPGWYSRDIEADNEADAREQFAEGICENLCAEHCIANNLDTDDGNDPTPKKG